MEETIILLKPDIFCKKERVECDELKQELPDALEFIAYVKTQLEFLGLDVLQEKKEILDLSIIEKHYAEHKANTEKFNFLKWYISSWPCYIMLVWWDNAIKSARWLIMNIREEFLKTPKLARKNMTHASDREEAANYEKSLYF